MLAIVAVFKNEADILDEWIQHYVLEGVSKLYLIDNGSTDGPSRVLDAYPPQLVEWWTDASPYAQVRLYNEALERIRAERHPPEWLLVCDLDEFLYASWGTIAQYVGRLPHDVGVVSVRWLMFGSSGHQQQPREGVVAGFFWRAHYPRDKDRECKTMVRLRALKELGIHEHVLQSPNRWKSIRHTASNEGEIASSPLRLNHYCIMSWERFRNVKMTRGNRGVFCLPKISPGGDAADPASANVRTPQYFQDHDFKEILDNVLHRKRQGYEPSTPHNGLLVFVVLLLVLLLTCQVLNEFQ